MKYLKHFLIVVIVMCSDSIMAQQHVKYNGVVMKPNLEISVAQISNQTISLVLHEIDMTKYESDNCDDCPSSKTLVLDVDFRKGFKFPITEEDSVYVRVTHLQKNLAESEHNLSQVEKINASQNISEEGQLKNNAELIKAKGQDIAKLMQEGKISPEDAQKQLLALTEPYLNKIDNSTIANTKTEEFNVKANFSLLFFNDETNTESEPYSGYLYIKEFNEKRFVAEFRGIDIEQCVEKRMASSAEESRQCKSVKSQYLTDTKVLREGFGASIINISIKEFLNNR